MLETGAGPIAVKVESAGTAPVALGRMRQPVPTWEPFDEEERLLAALGVQRSRLPVEVYCNGPRHLYVELPSREAVECPGPRPARPRQGCGRGGCQLLRRRGRATSRAACSRPAWASRRIRRRDPPPDPSRCTSSATAAPALGEEIEIQPGRGDPAALAAAGARRAARRSGIERVQVGGRAVMVARGELWLS